MHLPSLGDNLNVAIIGATGGLGSAFLDLLAGDSSVDRLFALSRTEPPAIAANASWLPVDITDESSIEHAAKFVRAEVGIVHLVIVASGILHDGGALQPEKTWRHLSARSLETAFRINTIGPALVAKHMLPMLARKPKAIFAAISARVGSISDNQLGGWYSYRASKAALSMLLRTLSIELARTNPGAVCVGLQPGTVDTDLSKPFQSNVPSAALFTPAFAAENLLRVLDTLTPGHSGRMFAWDGTEIPA